jgi:hypothetical protein
VKQEITFVVTFKTTGNRLRYWADEKHHEDINEDHLRRKLAADKDLKDQKIKVEQIHFKDD